MNEIISVPEKYQPKENCLKDKVILITGASDGIGATAAKSFAAHGASVILLGKTIPKLEKVYDEIINAGHPQPAIYPLDLQGATADHYAEMAESIEKEFGRLDGLLHNAAMLGSLIPISQYSPELWNKITQINLTAPFLLSQAMLPLLNKSTAASVLFTSSGVAREGVAYWGAYAVTKAAADNLMGIMADELEINTPIRVNSINPGRVRTRMRALAYPAEDPNDNPTAESIMPAYLYLMSDDSKEINGKIITV